MAAVQHPHAYMQRASPFATQNNALQSRALDIRGTHLSDSDSDDEPPPEIKFSKVTEALLKDRLLHSTPVKYISGTAQRPLRSTTTNAHLSTPQRPGIKILRKSSPSALGALQQQGSTPPRIVHVGSGQTGSARRTVSISGPYPHRLPSQQNATRHIDGEIVTPAPASRLYGSVRPRAGSNASHDAHRAGATSSSRPSSRDGLKSASDPVEARVLVTSQDRLTSASHAPDTLSRYTAVGLGRPRTGEQALHSGSQRVKRAAIATGTFLKSGPVRRGFRRRESEEEVSPTDEYNGLAASHQSAIATPHGDSGRSESQLIHAETVSSRATPVEARIAQQAPIDDQPSSAIRPASRQGANPLPRSRLDANLRSLSHQADQKHTYEAQNTAERVSAQYQDQAHANALQSQSATTTRQGEPGALQRLGSINRSYRHINDAAEDQENAPLPTFKRDKEQELKHLDQKSMAAEKILVSHQVLEAPRLIQQPVIERKALHSISNNTPYRVAPPPPPPKMSVLEIATATAGASTTKARKKRTHIVINGKLFTQMGRIGKGGSSEVFLVMAENYKTFAMKKVKLDNCDESAVRGFKGEIDLLKKLTDVDQVIRLYDWELNEEKQELLVLMERGDTDLYRIMTLKNGGHDGKFDITFTRYYWKEMLECVKAVHDHDVVHSDLKPANFLVVQGRLKLIDFGIANAIEVDHTCNVHRDSHVGTPNYMSPESIVDTSGSTTGRDAQGRPLRKDMKIGKSSDVWSLGCILYQMTYGRPPFAHIPTIPRIMAITNPKHVIEFPDTGIGGAAIPPSLKGVLKRCLQREAERRPTIPQLLSENNEFLYPEASGAVMMRQDVLEHIINKVVERCQDEARGMPPRNEVATYAPNFMAKIREMAEKV